MRTITILLIVSSLLYVIPLIIGLNLKIESINLPSCLEVTPDNTAYNCGFSCILANNLVVITFLLMGSITFSVLTIINLIMNGLNFGIQLSVALHNIPSYKVLLLTMPHGVFEIPAIIFAGAAGFKIPFEVVRYLLGRKNQVLTKEDLKEFLTLSLIAIVLIIIAAWIEANITLNIAKSIIEKSQLS